MKFSKMTIGQRIVAGFSLLTLVSATALGLGYLKLIQIDEDTVDITENALPGLEVVAKIQGNFRQSYSTTLEHILTRDAKAMADAEKEIENLANEIEVDFAAYEKTVVGPEGRKIYENAITARKNFVAAREGVLVLSRQNKIEEASAMRDRELEPTLNAYEAAVQAMYDRKVANAVKSGTEIKASVYNGKNTGAIGTGIAIVLSIGTAWTITRSTNRKLRDVVGLLTESTLQVSSAAGQVSGSSQSLAEGASEQAASLEETSASLEEISSMTKQNANNAQDAKQLANEARRDADTGATDMREMKGAMDGIKAASDNIARIIKTIDEIAFQTNILALNAAVEAARAGDAGMGFAVVADEVRNLAQRSAVAAKETAEKIEDCIEKSEAGVGITAKVSASLEQILVKNRRVDDLVGEIANASREQSQGIDQVNTAVTQMDKVTQSNAASAEESASAAEELNSQAQTLKEAVASLEEMVGGVKATGQSTSQPVTARPSKRIESPRPARSSFNALSNGAPHSERSVKPKGLSIPLEDAFKDF